MVNSVSDGGRLADRGPQLLVLMWTLTSLATIVVILRFWSRHLKRKFDWDDVLILLSLCCFYACSGCLTALCIYHGQRHLQDVLQLGDAVVRRVTLLGWIASAFGTLGLMAGKVSIAALLIGVFGPTDLFWHKLFLWVFCVGIAVPVSTAYAIFGLVQCSPPAALWDNRIHGKCVDAQVVADYGAFTGAYCTFVDVCLALLPATIFLRLHIRPVQKWQLSIVFALNILTSICSAIKSYHLAKLPKSTDFTWASYDVYAWHTGESFAILFCGTIPILKPVHDFIRRQKILSSWREGWKSRSSKSTTQKTSSRSWSDHRVQIGTISSHELGKYRWDETDRESTRVLVGKYGDI